MKNPTILLTDVLKKVALPNLVSSNGKVISSFGKMISGIEMFPTHSKSYCHRLYLIQRSRPIYWTLELTLSLSTISISTYQFEAHYDGDRSILDGHKYNLSDLQSIPETLSTINCLVDILTVSDSWNLDVRLLNKDELHI